MMVGDIVLFTKNDSTISSTYQLGIVREVFPGTDGKIRKVKVGYQNSTESSSRETIRAVRELIVIHKIDEGDIISELNKMYS
jgi:hypothetical protein